MKIRLYPYEWPPGGERLDEVGKEHQHNYPGSCDWSIPENLID